MNYKRFLTKENIKRAFFALAIILFISWLSNTITDVDLIFETIADGSPYMFTLAVIFQIGYLVLMAYHYQYAFWVVGSRKSFAEVFEKNLANIFFNVIIPAGGIAGMAYMAQILSNRKRSFGGNLVGVFLMLSTFYFGFFVLAAPSVIYLNSKNPYIASSAFIALLIFIGYALILYLSILLASKKPLKFKILFFRLKSLLKRLGRVKSDSYLSLGDATLERNLDDFAITAQTLSRPGGRLGVINNIGIGIFSNLYQVFILFLIFRAFNVDIDPLSIIVLYSLSYLFTVISPTPQGIGFVEGIVQLAMISLRIPSEDAFVITMAYRLVTAWLPVLLSVWSFKRVSFARSTGS